MKRREYNELETRAYLIGVNEAKALKRNVAPVQSKPMNELMNQVKNNLLPLLRAFNQGVCDEMSRQAWAVLLDR